MNLILTISFGNLYKQIENLTHKSISDYAKKIGADFISIDENHEFSSEVKITQDIYFCKILAINKYLHKYKRVAFIDTDIIIRPDAPNIFDVVPDDKIGLFNEGRYSDRSDFKSICDDLGFELKNWKGSYYNTGVMVIPRRYTTLFEIPENYKYFANEQPFLNFIFHKNKVDIFDISFDFNRLEILDKFTGMTRLNSYFVHYAGAPHEVILNLIEKDLASWSQDAPDYNYKRKIVIEVSGGMGDQFCSEPAIRWVIKLYPDAEIHVITHFKRLFSHLNDEIKLYDYSEWAGLSDTMPLKLYPCPSSDHSTHDLSHALLHPTDFATISMIKRTIPNIDKSYKIEVYSEDINSVVNKIGQIEKPPVLIHAGKWWPSKTLPNDWWQEVVDGLSEKLTPILIGKTIDSNQGYQNLEFKDGIIDLRDLTTLDELIALISITPCLLSNDSSPVHIAGAFDNWIVTIPTCKHADHILPYRHGTQYYKTKSLYKKLLIDDLEIRWTEFKTDTIDLLPEGKNILDYIPEPKEIISEILEIYNELTDIPVTDNNQAVKKSKKLKKKVHVLNVDDYFPELTSITLPLIKKWAENIGAEFNMITERKFPGFPATYEKLQVYEHGKDSDWNILIDADTVVNPDAPDITIKLKKDVVYMQYEFQASNQFKSNDIFKSDSRDIGIAGSFIITSDITHELWKPLDISMEDIQDQKLTKRLHILDEYTISMNLAKHKFKKDGIGYLNDFIHIGVEGEDKKVTLNKAKMLAKSIK